MRNRNARFEEVLVWKYALACYRESRFNRIQQMPDELLCRRERSLIMWLAASSALPVG
jgi:hypothetical protein